MLKLTAMLVVEETMTSVMMLKIVMVERLNYKLKVDFVLKMISLSVNISNMSSMR